MATRKSYGEELESKARRDVLARTRAPKCRMCWLTARLSFAGNRVALSMIMLDPGPCVFMVRSVVVTSNRLVLAPAPQPFCHPEGCQNKKKTGA